MFEINNRRYLGNKYKLLPFILSVVKENCTDINVFADLFAGTGAVSSAFRDKTLITNDILFSNYQCNLAWFGAETIDIEKLKNKIKEYNFINEIEENYVSENFANTFFSYEDCKKIGFIREDIQKGYCNGDLNTRERAILITSLLYSMDKIAKTCGHYDAFRRNVVFDQHLELRMPNVTKSNDKKNRCYNQDINELAPNIYADIVYLDPPYNSRQYCDAYHLLENIALWDKPQVFGTARKMDRSSLKSKYCTREANTVFEELIKSVNARYILLSYNNMAQKGNDRSNARLDDEDILRILNEKGETQIFSEKYKAFTTGKSIIRGNAERLFLCKCRQYEIK